MVNSKVAAISAGNPPHLYSVIIFSTSTLPKSWAEILAKNKENMANKNKIK